MCSAARKTDGPPTFTLDDRVLGGHSLPMSSDWRRRQSAVVASSITAHPSFLADRYDDWDEIMNLRTELNFGVAETRRRAAIGSHASGVAQKIVRLFRTDQRVYTIKNRDWISQSNGYTTPPAQRGARNAKNRTSEQSSKEARRIVPGVLGAVWPFKIPIRSFGILWPGEIDIANAAEPPCIAANRRRPGMHHSGSAEIE